MSVRAQERKFAPAPGTWRGFEFVTRVDVANTQGGTRVWLPIPSVDSEYQKSLDSTWVGNASVARIAADTQRAVRRPVPLGRHPGARRVRHPPRPSAFGYRELGGNPAKLQGAQHCRAEVFLKAHGWVAMDPADVGKVMRLETGEWIKDADHPVVRPVKQALFGGWEGNGLAFNTAHDVALPGATGGKLGFFMYPNAENAGGRLDSLDPDHFKYTITARETTA